MKNRVVVITGATGVLGQLAAKTFAEHGTSLALISNNQDLLDSLAKDLDLPDDRILVQTANLLEAKAAQDSAEAVSDKFGRVDALIHLVGGWTGGKTLKEASLDDFAFRTHQRFERHGFNVDYADLVKCPPPAPALNQHDESPIDLGLRSGSTAIDKGKLLPHFSADHTGRAPDRSPGP